MSYRGMHRVAGTAAVLNLSLLMLVGLTLSISSLHAQTPALYSHTVLVEVGTAQWCGPCAGWNTNIHNTYESGNYDFEYVEMIVKDHNNNILNLDAYQRMFNDYGLYAYPTSYFDGGYSTLVGNYPSQLGNYLDNAGARSVDDLTADMTITWMGNATFQVDINIQNNEATQYNGQIRAYILEPVSRYTTAYYGQYNNGFLGYAFNTSVSIAPGGSYSNSTTWNGNDNHDYQGTYFGDITSDNIKVILAVFDDTDGLVDETIAASPTDFIVDDTAPEFLVYQGSPWSTINHANAWGGSTHFIGPGTGGNISAWRTDTMLPPGVYDVYTYKFSHEYMAIMATNAQYIVKDRNGLSSYIYVDQSTGPSEWVYLGSFEFDGSGTQGVGITDNADGYVIADAIKAVYTGPLP